MSLATDVFLLIETEQKGITFSMLDKQLNNYTVGTCMGFCVFNIVFYMILFFYLDQVVPNEYG